MLNESVITLGQTNWVVTWIGHGRISDGKLKNIFYKENEKVMKYITREYDKWFAQNIDDATIKVWDRVSNSSTQTNLDKYSVQEAMLMDDIRNNRLTCEEAQERCEILWALLPVTHTDYPEAQANLMIEKYSQDPEWEYSKNFFHKTQ